MARKIFTDECGRRALGIVRVTSTVPPAATPARAVAAQPSASDAGAAHIEAPAWAVSWIPVDAGGIPVVSERIADGVMGSGGSTTARLSVAR
jgi:hypothetical protein